MNVVEILALVVLGVLVGGVVLWVLAAAWWHGRYSYSHWLRTGEHKRKGRPAEQEQVTMAGEWPPRSDDEAEAFLRAARGGLESDIDRLREAVRDYASHQSWRCDHPDRYPHEPDCPCGLVSTLRELGFDAEIASPCRNA